MQTRLNSLLSSKTLLVLAFLLSACDQSSADSITYHADFELKMAAETQIVQASLTITQDQHHLRHLNFYMPAEHFDNVVTNAPLKRDGDRVLVEVPAQGAQISWDVIKLSGRTPNDAQIADNWALFKLEDVFPAAKSRSVVGAVSESTLNIRGPSEWHFETAYGPAADAALPLPKERNFNRPKGWLVAGELGIRRDTIADRRVAVAAPKGYNINRVELLSFLNWTLPEFVRAFPDLPERLLVAGAPAHLWARRVVRVSIALSSQRTAASERKWYITHLA